MSVKYQTTPYGWECEFRGSKLASCHRGDTAIRAGNSSTFRDLAEYVSRLEGQCKQESLTRTVRVHDVVQIVEKDGATSFVSANASDLGAGGAFELARRRGATIFRIGRSVLMPADFPPEST